MTMSSIPLTRALIEERLAALASFKATPSVWAFTREAFMVHVEYAIADLITHKQLRHFRMSATEAKGNSVEVANLIAEVTDEWAATVVDKALSLISQEINAIPVSDASQPSQKETFMPALADLPDVTPDLIEAAAHAAHEANRAFAKLLGDTSHKAWDTLNTSEKSLAKMSVMMILNEGTTPDVLHETWRAKMVSEGWNYGPIKNATARIHPALRPYAELDPEQRYKNEMFCTVVKEMGSAYWRFPKQ